MAENGQPRLGSTVKRPSENGEQPKRMLTPRVSEELYRALTNAAKDKRVSLNEYVTRLLANHLGVDVSGQRFRLKKSLLTNRDRREIHSLGMSGVPHRDIAERFGISRGHVTKIINLIEFGRSVDRKPEWDEE